MTKPKRFVNTVTTWHTKKMSGLARTGCRALDSIAIKVSHIKCNLLQVPCPRDTEILDELRCITRPLTEPEKLDADVVQRAAAYGVPTSSMACAICC
jgi:hypothetical protein